MSKHVGLPYTKGSSTSEAAAESMVEPSKNQRQRVWEYINKQGSHGATRREIQQKMRMDGPRVTELYRLGRVEKRGTRRTTSNREADVYVAIAPKDWEDKRGGWPMPLKEMSENAKELALWKKRAYTARSAYRKTRKKLDDFAARGIV